MDSRSLRDLQRESEPPQAPEEGAETDPLLGQLVADRYRLVRKLADGAQASVYLAKHALIKRQVALKLLAPSLAAQPDLVKCFLDEGQVAGTIGHPNIVESLDMGVTEDGRPYLVLEYLEGMSLADEVYEHGALDPGRAAYVGVQIASALVAAHTHGIVHRDLKPDNVLLITRNGHKDFVKVVDFGISKIAARTESRGFNELIVGTPDYMAPEQVTSPRTVDVRADVFALGACLYEAVSGRSPLDLALSKDPLAAVLSAKPEPLARIVPGLPQALVAVIEKAMQKDRELRFATMAELGAALAPFASLPEVAPPSVRSPASGIQLLPSQASDSDRFAAAAMTGSFPSRVAESTRGTTMTGQPAEVPLSSPAPVTTTPPTRGRRRVAVGVMVLVSGITGAGLLLHRQHATGPAATGQTTSGTTPINTESSVVGAPVASTGGAVAETLAASASPAHTTQPSAVRGGPAPRAVARADAARTAPGALVASRGPGSIEHPSGGEDVPVEAVAPAPPESVAAATAAPAPAPVAVAAPSSTNGGGIVPFGDGMTRPSPIAPDEIRYSREALGAKVSGVVIVRCVIATTGETQSCRILKGLPFMDQPVLSAFAAHRGTPVMKNGQPITAEYTYTIHLKRD